MSAGRPPVAPRHRTVQLLRREEPFVNSVTGGSRITSEAPGCAARERAVR